MSPYNGPLSLKIAIVGDMVVGAVYIEDLTDFFNYVRGKIISQIPKHNYKGCAFFRILKKSDIPICDDKTDQCDKTWDFCYNKKFVNGVLSPYLLEDKYEIWMCEKQFPLIVYHPGPKIAFLIAPKLCEGCTFRIDK